MTLYLFVKDTGTSSTCYDQCATFWPPLLTTGTPQAGTGADQSLLGTTTRTDGKVEVTIGIGQAAAGVGEHPPVRVFDRVVMALGQDPADPTGTAGLLGRGANLDPSHLFWQGIDPIAAVRMLGDAVHYVQAHFANDLACRWNCKAAKCGSCSAEINGRPRLMCKTRVDEFVDQEIHVGPMRAFPLIKDLVTDASGQGSVFHGSVFLQVAQRTPLRMAGLLWRGLLRTGDAADQACLARLGLERPATFSERAYRALVSAALAR